MISVSRTVGWSVLEVLDLLERPGGNLTRLSQSYQEKDFYFSRGKSHLLMLIQVQDRSQMFINAVLFAINF